MKKPSFVGAVAFFLVLVVAAISVAITRLAAMPSQPTISAATASPGALQVGTSTTVTFTVPIVNSGLIPGSINLLQLNGSTLQPIILGQLRDDGQDGDLVAGDHVYTVRLQIAPADTGTLQFQVSAAFKGFLRRSLSPILSVEAYVGQAPLPPDPGLAGTLTIAGVDSANDGIRDDVERYIMLNYPSSSRMQSALKQIAVAQLAMIQDAGDPGLSRANVLQEFYGLDCLSAVATSNIPTVLNGIRAQVANTPSRMSAYFEADGEAGQLFYTYPTNPVQHCLVDPRSLPN